MSREFPTPGDLPAGTGRVGDIKIKINDLAMVFVGSDLPADSVGIAFAAEAPST